LVWTFLRQQLSRLRGGTRGARGTAAHPGRARRPPAGALAISGYRRTAGGMHDIDHVGNGSANEGCRRTNDWNPGGQRLEGERLVATDAATDVRTDGGGAPPASSLDERNITTSN
jgi:hypothetical protein